MELSHKHQVFLTISIVAVLFTIILLLIGPALRSNNLENDFKNYGYYVNSIVSGLEKANIDVKVLEVKQESCIQVNSEYIDQIKKLNNETYSATEKSRNEFRIIARRM